MYQTALILDHELEECSQRFSHLHYRVESWRLEWERHYGNQPHARD